MASELFEQTQTMFRAEMRLAFMASIKPPMKPKADHYDAMARHWLEHAQELGRPPYNEARRFTRDRWQLRGQKIERWQTSISGCEKPYGWCSRAFWKYVRLGMRAAFLAEWHRALGTQMPDHSGNRQKFAVISGLTS